MARGIGASLLSIWKKSTTLEKVFYISIVAVVLYIMATCGTKTIENFEQSTRFITKKGPDCLDDFYVSVYDDLLYNKIKNEYEIGSIINRTGPTARSRILDIGSGTGHHVGELQKRNYKVEGLDSSPAMIKKAKENYPKCKFSHGNAMKSITFPANSFTHITVMYFTIYSIKDKRTFFQNCYSWLIPGGWLVLHLVDRDSFDPILPVADIFAGGLDPQKYSKERLMQTKASFSNHDYKAVFSINQDKNMSYLDETFQHKKNGEVRKNRHIFYMPTQKDVLALARSAGFILSSESEMKKVGYANQYIYVLQKPE
mgnify:FL=1